MEEMKNLTIKDLLAAFKQVGYPKSRSWFYREELKGNLVVPRSTTNYKKAQGDRKIGFVREMTETQVKNIIQAFLPGGVGFYDYRKDN